MAALLVVLGLISSTRVPAGDLRETRRSPRNAWLALNPSRTSITVKLCGTLNVRTTSPPPQAVPAPSGMACAGTSSYVTKASGAAEAGAAEGATATLAGAGARRCGKRFVFTGATGPATAAVVAASSRTVTHRPRTAGFLMASLLRKASRPGGGRRMAGRPAAAAR